MGTPLAVHVTAAHRKHLKQVREGTTDRRLWARVTAILMSAEGTPATQIATVLGVTPQSISNWRNRWIDHGAFSLKDAPRSGAPKKVTPRYMRLMAEAIDRGPQAYGYVLSTWSVKRLVAHLHRKTRIRLSHQHLRHLLHQSGFVCRRPKHTLKGKRNEWQYRKAKKQLEDLKRGL
jgi:transposase